MIYVGQYLPAPHNRILYPPETMMFDLTLFMWEEKQELRLVEFEKEWKSWQSTFEDLRKKSVEIDEKILKYDENYRSLVKVRSEMDKFIERIERRIAEISEIQRIKWNVAYPTLT